MQKLSLQTPDITSENIEKIKALFPEVITEREDENGTLVKGIDFELLKQELAKDIVDGSEERYRLDWPGKRRSILKANTPINKTLVPDKESSVNFDNTKNIYIEGDNFEVLKILQESYLNKIKMIYIDPPYNTGKDFVYKDDFKKTKEEYEEELGLEDEEGGRLFKNTDTNGRFHSDWLSMMYERLVIARDLLKDDGVIFISIDDNEVHNLRKICDEIFGEENFLSQFVWKTRQASGKQVADNNISIEHEYIILYQKSILKLRGVERNRESYTNPDNDPRGDWAKHPLDVGSTKDERPNCYYDLIDPKTGFVYKANVNRVWAFSPDSMKKLLEEGKIIFDPRGKNRPYLKKFWTELKNEFMPISTWLDKDLFDIGYNTEGTKLVNGLFDDQKFFDYPKPLSILKLIIKQASTKDDIVLDFFSGSATTAHAVMQLNAEDGGNRKFVMVQLPEQTDEKSEAFKAGYKTIAEIGRERIRRAGKKILEENADKLKERETPLDIGFRAYKVADTIYNDVFVHPNQLQQSMLDGLADNIKSDKSPEDILTAVMLSLGLTLDLSIKSEKVGVYTVFTVADGALVACFDLNIDMHLVETIANQKPLRAVFRDASFKNDQDRINTETTFKQLSPETRVSVI